MQSAHRAFVIDQIRPKGLTFATLLSLEVFTNDELFSHTLSRIRNLPKPTGAAP